MSKRAKYVPKHRHAPAPTITAAPRKILRNTLGRWLEDRGVAGDFDVQRRAEEVPVAEYLALAQRAADAQA